jgi:hypothetical protein
MLGKCQVEQMSGELLIPYPQKSDIFEAPAGFFTSDIRINEERQA